MTPLVKYLRGAGQWEAADEIERLRGLLREARNLVASDGSQSLLLDFEAICAAAECEP